MKGHRILSHIAAIFFLACVCVSCESSSSSSYDPGGSLPPIGELVGSWAGHFFMGENGLAPDDNEYGDSFDTYFVEPDDDDIFVTAIITREKEARFIGDVTQYVCLENSFGVNRSLKVRAFFGGVFDHYTYTSNTGGIGPYAADVARKKVAGQALFTTDHLYGCYCDDVDGADLYYWEVLNLNSASASSDVKKIAGKWRINDSFYAGNTLVLTITTTGEDEYPGRGTIEGLDHYGNSFDGEIIEIHYDDLTGVDLYDVSLSLTPNEPVDGEPFDLKGLAAFYDTEGVSSLAIGVSGGDPGERRMVTGIAEPVVVP